MNGKLHQSKLTLAQSFVEGVEVENVLVAHGLLEPVDPKLLVLSLWEEDQARLVGRDHQLYRVEGLTVLLIMLSLFILFDGGSRARGRSFGAWSSGRF